ncbi:MAG: hypothetical protein J6W70_05590 [Lentisphaeria bacterium]|nr:hypothetical protein [Lentisphaeria bacterium]
MKIEDNPGKNGILELIRGRKKSGKGVNRMFPNKPWWWELLDIIVTK